MEVPPGLDVLQIINFMTRIPNREEGSKMIELLVPMYINQAIKKHETSKTTRKRPSNQIYNDRKETKESAKQPKQHQFNKTENSKDTSKLIECLLVFEKGKCYICEKIFDKTSIFVNHLREHNNLCDMVELKEGQLRNIIQCALCAKTFTSNGFAIRHVNASHKAIKEICDSDAFIPKKQTPLATNNPPPIAESSNATAIQPTGQTLVTNNQNGGILDNRQTPLFCSKCRIPDPFAAYKAYMAVGCHVVGYNNNLGGECERSINTHTAAHMNYQGNVNEEVSIERNVQEAAKETNFNPKAYRFNPLWPCPPMNIHDNDMEKECVKRNNAQRSNVSHNVRSMNETTVVPGNNSQACTTSEREIIKGAEEESFATNSNNSKVNTECAKNFYNEIARASKEIFGKETVEEDRVTTKKTFVPNEVTAAHTNYQGNVNEEVSIERNVQEAAKETTFNSKTYRLNPLWPCPPMNIHDNDMQKECVKRNNAQRSNVSHNARSVSETTVVPGNSSQPCTTSEREITKGAEEETFATNSNNSKVTTAYDNNFYKAIARTVQEFFSKETVEKDRVTNKKTPVTIAFIDISDSDDEDAISQLNNTPSSIRED